MEPLILWDDSASDAEATFKKNTFDNLPVRWSRLYNMKY